MFEALAAVSGAAWALYGRLMEAQEAENPSVSVRLFHRAVAEARLAEIGNLFSFAFAYQYWQDVTAALGTTCPSEEAFKHQLLGIFAAVRAEASSYTPSRLSAKVIGQERFCCFREGRGRGCRVDGARRGTVRRAGERELSEK